MFRGRTSYHFKIRKSGDSLQKFRWGLDSPPSEDSHISLYTNIIMIKWIRTLCLFPVGVTNHFHSCLPGTTTRTRYQVKGTIWHRTNANKYYIRMWNYIPLLRTYNFQKDFSTTSTMYSSKPEMKLVHWHTWKYFLLLRTNNYRRISVQLPYHVLLEIRNEIGPLMGLGNNYLKGGIFRLIWLILL